MSSETISNIDEKIRKRKEKIAQLEKQKRIQDNQAKEKARKMDTRREIIIGGMVIKYFPSVSHFQPRLTEAENNIEFAELELLLSVLAEDKDYVRQLREQVTQKIMLANK